MSSTEKQHSSERRVHIEVGTHFWAKMDGKLAVMCRCKNYINGWGNSISRYFVCGGWEGSINESDFEFIEAIEMPKEFSVDDIYYK